ncbi:putative F-box domain, FBD domain, leucine-rich repeat domain, L domain-containing protein [Medicago truncatula]|uniref:Putative F-box domain, FBD domain, leucine-rich repeat domain, L domain-containing protein n=1 Tax=Medicago truncatula TaxID=3880 RepID=A0A396H4T1_MEDTR|nr:putative F-box domain, FBD domain, leucine-rich repeat domain, L domain-containing protein [Medicago truncatula]
MFSILSLNRLPKMSSSSHKKRRLRKSSKVDRISDLPDSILCHILYFLPTKLAATTSVLSKRWKLLWLSVLAFDFDSSRFKTSDLFLRVVYSTIYRRDIALPIHSFHLKSRSWDIQKDVNQFVYLVGQRGILNLCLDLSKICRYIIELPTTILSSGTLKVLKLRNLIVGDNSQVDLHLPSLKTLHLNRVDFECHEHLMKILLSCPILEDLETKLCCVMDFQSRFSDEFAAFPNLIKARITEFYIPLSMVCKAKTLHIEVPMFTNCKHLPMFESLTYLKLSLSFKVWYPKWKWLMRMLKLSPKLQNLIIKDNEDLEEKIDECWKDPPNIPECLSSQLKTCRIRVFKGTQYDLQFAIYIMENSKVLETMRINSIRSLDINEKYQLLAKLSSSTRGSTTCKLLFN